MKYLVSLILFSVYFSFVYRIATDFLELILHPATFLVLEHSGVLFS